MGFRRLNLLDENAMNPKQVRGTAIRAWRASDSLEQVAVIAKVCRATIENWEAGRSEPRVTQAFRCEQWRPGFLRAVGLAA